MAIGTLIYFLIIMGLFLGISRGMGSFSGTLREIAFFSMEKAPVGLVDLFSKKKGSAATYWMTLGLIWMPIASTLTFVNLWSMVQTFVGQWVSYLALGERRTPLAARTV